MNFDFPYLGDQVPSKIISEKSDLKSAKHDVLKKITSTFDPKIVNPDTHYGLNTWGHQEFYDNIDSINSLRPKGLQFLPDTILIKVNYFWGSSVFTLIHNKDHYNVSMIFFENDRRRPESDSLTLIPGMATSYPNLFIEIKSDQVKTLGIKLKQAESQKDIWKILKDYGTSRSSSQFWSQYEWFSDHTIDTKSNESGWLDLNRYMNL